MSNQSLQDKPLPCHLPLTYNMAFLEWEVLPSVEGTSYEGMGKSRQAKNVLLVPSPPNMTLKLEQIRAATPNR